MLTIDFDPFASLDAPANGECGGADAATRCPLRPRETGRRAAASLWWWDRGRRGLSRMVVRGDGSADTGKIGAPAGVSSHPRCGGGGMLPLTVRMPLATLDGPCY